jgi:hypothetical protein
MSRDALLVDRVWHPNPPSAVLAGTLGRAFRDHRRDVDERVYRYRYQTETTPRELRTRFGPWQSVEKWHRPTAYVARHDATWDKLFDGVARRPR